MADFALAFQIHNRTAQPVLGSFVDVFHHAGAIQGIKRLTFWREHNVSAGDLLAALLDRYELHQHAAIALATIERG